jgi:hypothetical protein
VEKEERVNEQESGMTETTLRTGYLQVRQSTNRNDVLWALEDGTSVGDPHTYVRIFTSTMNRYVPVSERNVTSVQKVLK